VLLTKRNLEEDHLGQSSDVGIGQNAALQGLTECAPFGADIDQRGDTGLKGR
jgi:hypothetical protein